MSAGSWGPESESREADAQGARDAATVLPFVAAVLLLPPVVLIFAAPALIGGIPLIVLYIFGVWAAVILAAMLAARRLAAPPVTPPDSPD